MDRMADRLVAGGPVEEGPRTPVLHQKHLDGATSCHQNELGQARHGRALLELFGP